MSVEFFDSNIFVYLFDETNENKRNTTEHLINNALQDQQGCISFQVIQETLNVITRKFITPITHEDAKRFLDLVLKPLWKVNPSTSLYNSSLDIQKHYRFSFYDSLIVAAALEGNCTKLFSEDMQHGQQIGVLTIVNPFKEN